MIQQLNFDFATNDNYSVENFIIFKENVEAFYCLNKNKDDENMLNNQIILLNGEKKCGKTHLGQIWKQNHNAKNISINDLYKESDNVFISKIASIIEKFDYYLLDDLPADIEEEKLFYLINTIITSNSNILMISDYNLAKKKIKLKDLKSRINCALVLNINKLSKDSKPMLINKLFADKQIFISGDVLRFLNKAINTSYKDVYDCVEYLSSKTMENKQKLNLSTVKSYFN